MEYELDPIEFATRDEAEAAGKASGFVHYLLVKIEGEWAEADEYSQPAIDAGNAEAWGVADETGEQMLGADGEWYFVA